MNGRQLYDFGVRGLGGIDASDKRYFFDCLNTAAAEFVRETRCLTGTVTITTVAGQNGYALPWDFIDLHIMNRRRQNVIKYTDESGSESLLPHVSIEKIFTENLNPDLSHPAPMPVRYSITDMASLTPTVSGTATSTGAADGGLCTLTDSAADFSGIAPRDGIRNKTDKSDGIVIEKVSDTSIKIALFNGDKNDVSLGDVYVITPAARKWIYLDPAPAVNGESVTVPYIAMPNPVYTDDAVFRFEERSARAVAYYGAYLYVSDLDFAPDRDLHLRKMYEDEVNRKKRELARNILSGSPYGGYRERW